MEFRYQLKTTDCQAIREILTSTGFFYDFEIDIAVELAELNLEKGAEKSGYDFVMLEETNQVVGFSCFGATPCTQSSYDLYWIAVHHNHRNKGLGKLLLAHSEELIAKKGEALIWVETSSRPIYEPTRAFYEKTGYTKQAELPDFYAPNDNKVIFLKKF